MAIGNRSSLGQKQDGRSRFTRLTAAPYPRRLAAEKIPPFNLRGTIEVISNFQPPNSIQTLSEQDTRPSIGNGGQAGEVGAAPTFTANNSLARMSIHQLMTWTRLGGQLALLREIPRGMAVDLTLNGRKSNWRLVGGSRPKDAVLGGI